MASQLMPLELIDRCIGSRMRVIMKGDKGIFSQRGDGYDEACTDNAGRVQRYTSRIRRLCQYVTGDPCIALLQYTNKSSDMVLEDVTE